MVKLPSSDILDLTIPITRFNKGEASKIFDEVRSSGCKIVIKNNKPACVLISPDKYREMMDELEDVKLYDLVAERLKNDTGVTIPAVEVYRELGIEANDLDDIYVEYGVDFE